MNGKSQNSLSFVGAMKIARNPTVSERLVEWYAPIPGSLSEGAAERSEAEGVYFVARNKSKISEFIMTGG